MNKVGWYSIYEQPGHGKNAVFAAHVNFNKKDGPFARLKTVEEGDQVFIDMDGGPTYVYEVLVFRRYDVDTIPTGDLIAANDRPEGEEWITLITWLVYVVVVMVLYLRPVKPVAAKPVAGNQPAVNS